jgi:predicted ABC-type ATPase
MKSITSFIAMLAVVAGTVLPMQATFAATQINSGDLIKASGQAVYYYGADGKRYVFPTEKTFLSWYDNFNTVKNISDVELAALPIGGNVTYRPGVRMLKITTDPKTYAVDAHGTLRHVTSEQVAKNLYGDNWNTKIDDIPDPFFINYALGNAIENASDFNISTITNTASSINLDKKLTTTPPPDETEDPIEEPEEIKTINFSVNDSTPRPGDVITFSASTKNNEQAQTLSISMDTVLLTTCNNTSVCTVNYQIPFITDKSTLTAKAEITFLNQTKLSEQITVTITEDAVASGVYISADRTNVKVGQSTGIVVDAPNIAVKRIEVFVNGAGKTVCESGIRTCRYSLSPEGGVGTSVTVHGLVTDNVGRTYRSKDLTVTVSANDSPLITVQGDKNTIYTGEKVNVTVAASDQDGIKYIEILDSSRQIIKHCEGAVPCTYNVGPWQQTGSYTFYGRATDALNATDEQFTVITVTNP